MDQKEYAAMQKVFQDIPEICGVVSLGAYRGEDDPVFRSMCKNPGLLIHWMVEPDYANCETIEKQNNRRAILVHAAVGAATEVRKFTPSYDETDGHTGSGSILEPTGHKTHIPRIKFGKPYDVQCFCLDDLAVDCGWQHVDLLWVDIQGAEAEMILGGQETLRKKVHYCFMETEHQELYAGQELEPVLIAMMEGLGFEVMERFEYNTLFRNKAWK